MILVARAGLGKYETGRFRLNIPMFSVQEWEQLISLFYPQENSGIVECMMELIRSARSAFEKFVPSRLEEQINPYLSMGDCIGRVTETLIRRGVLETPRVSQPLTYGVFHVSDSCVI
jgi:hypothetical protein